MEYTYKTKGGVCSRRICFQLEDDDIVKNIRFVGGCSGNTQGVSSLAEGMKAEELVRKLKNIKCGFKDSSCPDQLALAVEEALKNRKSTQPKGHDEEC